MCKDIKAVAACLAVLAALMPAPAGAKKRSRSRREEKEITESTPAILWRNPTDISSRKVFYGPGGEQDQPHTVFRFVKEDLKGTSPKFVVKDQEGVSWKVKLGPETRPETVAARLVWAVGYFADEDYFLPVLRVEGMPRLRRGRKLVSPDGSVHNARLKRYVEGQKKIGLWHWRRNPFAGTRQLNGLRVMMALLNNWDVKDENNSIYEEKMGQDGRGPELHYVVSDLGASFGSTGPHKSQAASKGNLRAYARSRFIRRVTPQYVDFGTPSGPTFLYIFDPRQLAIHLRTLWIGKRVPRSDARWIGSLLAQLSPDQICDAFRAAGYSSEQVQAFSNIVRERIGELNKL